MALISSGGTIRRRKRAKALWMKGFQLHVTSVTGIEKAGTDPTDRLLQVIAIVDEPRAAATRTVSGFAKRRSRVGVLRVKPQTGYLWAGKYRPHAGGVSTFRAHTSGNNPRTPSIGVGYVITERMAALYRQRRSHRRGRARWLIWWRRARKAAVALFQSVLRSPRGKRAGSGSSCDGREGRADADDARKRRSGLRLAQSGGNTRGLRPSQKDYGALWAFDSYVVTYPTSPWAWTALLRAAQCRMLLGSQMARPRPVTRHCRTHRLRQFAPRWQARHLTPPDNSIVRLFHAAALNLTYG
jgi:hypothetical protein